MLVVLCLEHSEHPSLCPTLEMTSPTSCCGDGIDMANRLFGLIGDLDCLGIRSLALRLTWNVQLSMPRLLALPIQRHLLHDLDMKN
ncbi:hypothetical protein CYLTODRAFT_264171 [Cylindrobasidium torrendii FP15055 ss-10]|uniref:Uncharacterized protein n=1 Tax=Cylindrobasidium torrendii FP15055 ss-10 TaxID=1314674 RepID=A0A0D7BFC3_9AGAR|nr:hypothetical protein CYLTODRAFT_264171 [Cylindrobasidium torrendii FP15055 ss-10]